MPFLYFIPSDANQITPTDIDRLGLGYAIDHPTPKGCIGPDGRRGFIMGRNPKTLHAMHAETQSWIPAPKLGQESPPYWVGFDSKPTAEDLARGEQVTSVTVETTGGYKWNVPKLVMWQEGDDTPAVWNTPLPVCIDLDDNGNPIDGAVVPQYREMFDIGLRVLTRLAGGNDGGLSSSQLIRFAANCIGVNYRVSLLELSSRVLGCLSTEDALRVIHAAIDWQGYRDAVGNWDGRQGRPTTATGSGSAEPTPASSASTDPPLAN
ncbi:hypothetical protein [Planctomycetes bacterium TBK1r]|uniref:Primase C-terminal 1 domain-containing protein n=1 Tax=Stieleria magnilauensis TaxID=2527963 RepID=A0ABX5XSM4_9BACT|nr:hypothetical protein TBK1r_39490 [Planctomycetes bacterium TBK1r]